MTPKRVSALMMVFSNAVSLFGFTQTVCQKCHFSTTKKDDLLNK